VKLVTCTVVPDIWPFFVTKLREIRSHAGSFIVVIGKDRANFAAASALSLPGIYVTWNPAEGDCFHIISKICIVFG